MVENTHDEMKMWRDLASISGLVSATVTGEQIRAIVAMVDALAAQLTAAQQQIAALQEALTKVEAALPPPS